MSITIIIGPMFSGKTTEFIRLIDRKKIADKRCLIIKHPSDDRFDDRFDDLQGDINSKNKYHITTHSKIRYDGCDIKYITDLTNEDIIENIIKTYDVVGIEEGFFFKNIGNFCNILANNGIDIIVATLDSSYRQELFSEIGCLIAISEDVIKLKAICMQCKKADASFTIRTVDSDEEILVGGKDIYKSVCRKCLVEFNKCKKNNKDI